MKQVCADNNINKQEKFDVFSKTFAVCWCFIGMVEFKVLSMILVLIYLPNDPIKLWTNITDNAECMTCTSTRTDSPEYFNRLVQ